MATVYEIEFGDPATGEIEQVYTQSMRAAEKVTDACVVAGWYVNLTIRNDDLYMAPTDQQEDLR
jgi:hypothetical protein